VREGRRFAGVDAVIDKDLASAKLSREVGVDIFVIATDVPGAALDYGTARERFLTDLSLDDAKRFLAEDHFPPAPCNPRSRPACTS
jgi:carbamate kinase